MLTNGLYSRQCDTGFRFRWNWNQSVLTQETKTVQTKVTWPLPPPHSGWEADY